MPFEKITVTELCRAADVSRITFYTYYDDKYALADRLFKTIWRKQRNAIARSRRRTIRERFPPTAIATC